MNIGNDFTNQGNEANLPFSFIKLKKKGPKHAYFFVMTRTPCHLGKIPRGPDMKLDFLIHLTKRMEIGAHRSDEIQTEA